jgi:transmembrane sensor
MDDLRSLFVKYLNDDCSVAEIKLLMKHFSEAHKESELKGLISAAMFDEDYAQEEEALDEKMQFIYEQLKPALTGVYMAEPIVKPITNYFKYAVAAAILLIASLALYFYVGQNPIAKNGTAMHLANDINPGGNKAILTLADGSKISLTDAADGELTKQAGVSITKTEDGQIVYQVIDAPHLSTAVTYNTISTPAGGQYQVNLPDGTTVWLNALSSLKYPTVFSTQERKVILTGEAYFEVAKDPSKPFIVAANGGGRQQQVRVLGTHFNINSYDDELSTRTTLLEGSVEVNALDKAKTLKPGQQAVLTKGIAVQEVDVNQAIDWKNGNFYMDDESIQSIMRRLSRWYDLDVVYQGNVPANLQFGGVISRTKKLSEVLQVLETAQNIHFKIEGRRVTVMQ